MRRLGARLRSKIWGISGQATGEAPYIQHPSFRQGNCNCSMGLEGHSQTEWVADATWRPSTRLAFGFFVNWLNVARLTFHLRPFAFKRPPLRKKNKEKVTINLLPFSFRIVKVEPRSLPACAARQQSQNSQDIRARRKGHDTPLQRRCAESFDWRGVGEMTGRDASPSEFGSGGVKR